MVDQRGASLARSSRARMALACCGTQPLRCFSVALRDAQAALVHGGERKLRVGVTGLRRFVIPDRGFGKIHRRAFTLKSNARQVETAMRRDPVPLHAGTIPMLRSDSP